MTQTTYQPLPLSAPKFGWPWTTWYGDPTLYNIQPTTLYPELHVPLRLSTRWPRRDDSHRLLPIPSSHPTGGSTHKGRSTRTWRHTNPEGTLSHLPNDHCDHPYIRTTEDTGFKGKVRTTGLGFTTWIGVSFFFLLTYCMEFSIFLSFFPFNVIWETLTIEYHLESLDWIWFLLISSLFIVKVYIIIIVKS